MYKTTPSINPNEFRLSQQKIVETTISTSTLYINRQKLSPIFGKVLDFAMNICIQITSKPGIHSNVKMKAAGFTYTNEGDAARCDVCQLLVDNWTKDMDPFTIHAQRSPSCAFVRSMRPSESTIPNCSKTVLYIEDQQLPKRVKLQTPEEPIRLNPLTEVNMLKNIRERTFSHWPHQMIPSSSQMIQAGFFCCNVGDRVMCLYCNLICQQWMANSDDPWEVHRLLSPKCPLVLAQTKPPTSPSAAIPILNDQSNGDQPQGGNMLNTMRWAEVAHSAACRQDYIEIPRREASFATWPTENLPSVDSLVRAGFFFTGIDTVVTCFYCNGSLQNWGRNDNPMIEHARWFPNCAYIKQLCGPELYRRIQESKRAQQEQNRGSNSSVQTGSNNANANSKLVIPDESTLSRYVAARLDLEVSQRLLNLHYKLAIIKRCWEDQLRLKRDDYVDVCELLIACIILQKQIDHIGGKKENITVPSIAIRQYHEKNQSENSDQEQSRMVTGSAGEVGSGSTSSNSATNPTNPNIPRNPNSGLSDRQKETANRVQSNSASSSSSTNMCVICYNAEKSLACVPCGHLASCVACGCSFRTCPICRKSVEGFVRVYL